LQEPCPLGAGRRVGLSTGFGMKNLGENHTMTLKDLETAIEHVRSHMAYPATKDELVQACNRMMDVPEEEREWFRRTLPEGTYKSPEEVLSALRV